MTPAEPKARRRCYRRHILAAALCLIAAAGSAEDSKSGEESANDCGGFPFLDWSDQIDETDESPVGQRSQRCGGRYVDPLQDVDTSQDPATAEIQATATRSELEGDMVRLFGGVEARQGYRVLRAAEAEYDRAEGLATLLGEVELREPGLLMRGSTGSFDSVSGEARLTANQFVVHEQHVRGGAGLVVRRPDGVLELNDGYYSYCPPLSESWILHAEEIELDFAEGVGKARDAKIEMDGVPIFYTPFMQFPIDDRRRSGFLFPDLGRDSNGGLDIATPYYLNLAPNYDATVTPRFIADRGILTELEFRYLSRQLGYWELGGAWIGDDDEYQDEFPDEDGERWLRAANQRGLFNQRWRTRIDYTETSDEFYFSDIDTTSLQVTQSLALPQLGEVTYLGDNWNSTLRLEDYQLIAQDIVLEPYSKLPQLTVDRSATGDNFRPNLLFASDYAYFDNSEDDEGHRLYNEIGVEFPMEAIWGFAKPTVKYRQLNFDLEEEIRFDGDLTDTPDVGAPMFSFDAGLFFERFSEKGMQTLEPRIYYLWSDFEEQRRLPAFDTTELTFTFNQLFRETRFTGRQRIDDSNQLTLALTTRWIDMETGAEKLVASIGQIFYFDDRLVNIGRPQDEDFEDTSDIAAELNLTPNEDFSFRSSVLWNTRQDEFNQANIVASYTGYGNAVFNLGYSFRRDANRVGLGDDLEQVELSTYLPINRQWAVFFGSLYDTEDKDRVNDIVGFEYNNCCWRTRVLYQRFLDQRPGRQIDEDLLEYEEGYFVEFQFKGLGGVGTRVTDMLEEFIRGYSDNDV